MKLFSFLRRSAAQKSMECPCLSFDNLSTEAYRYLNEQQENCKATYKLLEYQNWYYDQPTGKLTFSDDGITKLIIDYEEVGSVSQKTNTWLWSWGNPHVDDKVKTEITKVRSYGVKCDLPKLVTAKWNADESDGWEMTAIAAFLLKAKGAYRVPHKENDLFSFVIFKEINWAEITISLND